MIRKEINKCRENVCYWTIIERSHWGLGFGDVGIFRYGIDFLVFLYFIRWILTPPRSPIPFLIMTFDSLLIFLIPISGQCCIWNSFSQWKTILFIWVFNLFWASRVVRAFFTCGAWAGENWQFFLSHVITAG